MKRFPAKEYDLPFFHEAGYVRKLCPTCKSYFWTKNPDQETCGEASSKGCGVYTFLGHPPTKKGFTLHEMRESFLSFFEKQGHTRIRPYPVVARWREDLYLTHASIIDFQPYVTNGLAPPPANPLVLSQPCIRLVDIDNTGPTFGRHLTIFEMGGAHAFNYPDKEVYWKDQTVRYQNQWVTRDLGVMPEDIVYKEEIWSGGGNAGPCLESVIRGLEVDTLVFMQYKVVDGEFVRLPIRTVDTGYGIDRYSWVSQGVPSGFHAIYGELLCKIFKMAGLSKIDEELLVRVAKVSGLVSLDKAGSRIQTRRKEAQLAGLDLTELDRFITPIENAFAVADHSKTLCFILSEGVVPSNIQEGYLARLVFRRLYRLLRMLEIPAKLYNIMDMQFSLWSRDFPQIKEMRSEITEMVKVEEEKFEETIKRGQGLIRRISEDLRKNGKKEMPPETLTELYDSQGLPPEIVKQVAAEESLKVEVPDNFYTLIAERHMQVSKPVEAEVGVQKRLEKPVEKLAATEPLYYQDQYMKEFEARVLKVVEKEYVVLDRTCFFPEGGGQPPDNGSLRFDGKSAEVVDVQKVGVVIVHKVKGDVPEEDSVVKGRIDWERRYSLMKNHTATHVIGGAAKRVLGQHVWQYGTQKGIESSRLDISHFRRLSLEELHKIETLANQAVMKNIKVDISWMPRNEAESRYGFRLYQGGAIPGKEIRVVRAGNWDVEACAGTHLKSTGEIGFIKIVHSERVQDGVERLEYSVGVPGLRAVQALERSLVKLSETFDAPLDKLNQTAQRMVKELREANAERRKLIKELAARESVGGEKERSTSVEKIDEIKIVKRDFGNSLDEERMVQTAAEMVKKDEASIAVFYASDGKRARIIVMAGKSAVRSGANAGLVVKEAAQIIGGGGGGRPDFGQGGGTVVAKLQEAVAKAGQTLGKQVRP